jgi:hypothetical protein
MRKREYVESWILAVCNNELFASMRTLFGHLGGCSGILCIVGVCPYESPELLVVLTVNCIPLASAMFAPTTLLDGLVLHLH